MDNQSTYAFCKKLLETCPVKGVIKTPVGVQKILTEVYGSIDNARKSTIIDTEFFEIMTLKSLGFERNFIKRLWELSKKCDFIKENTPLGKDILSSMSELDKMRDTVMKRFGDLIDNYTKFAGIFNRRVVLQKMGEQKAKKG